jgi:hypothetical protein
MGVATRSGIGSDERTGRISSHAAPAMAAKPVIAINAFRIGGHCCKLCAHTPSR